MHIPEKIWQNRELDIYDKLILGVINNGGDKKTAAEIAEELGITQTRVSRKIHRMNKEGLLAIIIAEGQRRMEVTHA